MNIRKATTLAAIAATVTTASASSIAVSFNRNNDEVFLATDTVGLVAQSNWNQTTPSNARPATGAIADIIDDAGTTTTADLSWNAHGTWANGGLATPSAQMLKGYLDDNGPTGINIDITNIPYASYDVYLYFNNDFGGGTTSLFDIDVNSTNYTTSGSFTQPQAGVFDSGNSIIVTGLSGDLNLSSGERTNPGISTITGFQIVEVPEPSSTALLGLGGLALLLRRRK